MGCDWQEFATAYDRGVSIHAPARGATLLQALSQCSLFSFNPRTRTGCDFHCSIFQSFCLVSIHAPARGATSCRNCVTHVSYVSIHAPARGATIRFFNTILSDTGFNPRTRTGCDSFFNTFFPFISVSIHAPARGATPSLTNSNASFVVSIHAPARGATPCQSNANGKAKFQSTHPHGVRRVFSARPFIQTLFQSTHPHGVRHSYNDVYIRLILVSIHAPARGATCISRPDVKASLFQSTHPHGVRPYTQQ